MYTAEAQVLQVIHMNVHLDYGTDGKRYIERFTEIIPLAERIPYPELDKNNLEWSKANVEREYYMRSTDRKTFECKDVIRWNKKTNTYEAHNCPSEQLITHMLRCIPEDHVEEFMDFVERTWIKRGLAS